MKRFLSLLLTLTMILGLGVSAFAANETPSITIKPNVDSTITESTTIKYTYYKILSASIDTDPKEALDGSTTTDGVVAYYVEVEAQATALAGLKTSDNKAIFNVTRVGDTNKWYVELNKETNATGEQIAEAFNNATFLANFTKQEYTSTGGDAVLPNITAGYYFIDSSLGSKMAVQTTSEVVINEKNQYVSDEKTIPTTDEHSQIGQEITYTLTVNVPATATEQIVLTDTMSKGLTFKEVKSQKIGETVASDAQKGAVSDVASADNDATKFTITWAADQVKAIVGDPAAAKVITVEVTVIVNGEAAIDTEIPNTLDLKYGNNYDAKPSTVNTRTTKFEFDKVDGTDKTTKLTGAEFQLLQNNSVVKLIKVEEGKTYRVATAAEITAAGDALVDTIVTNGNTVTINGLDGDLTYQLKETKAPTGYNKMEPDTIDVTPTSGKIFAHRDVENNKGPQLPSTGGIGTTIFYIIGGLLAVGAGVVLVTKKRMGKEEN
jgi:fimbrial isopeptide formation D2 family protein/LPXTG-motif cell wall-anchored protein